MTYREQRIITRAQSWRDRFMPGAQHTIILPARPRADVLRDSHIAPESVSTRRTNGGGRVPRCRMID